MWKYLKTNKVITVKMIPFLRGLDGLEVSVWASRGLVLVLVSTLSLLREN